MRIGRYPHWYLTNFFLKLNPLATYKIIYSGWVFTIEFGRFYYLRGNFVIPNHKCTFAKFLSWKYYSNKTKHKKRMNFHKFYEECQEFQVPRSSKGVGVSWWCFQLWLVFGRDTVWDKYVDETRNDEQISDGRVLRTGVFRKSLVRDKSLVEISCSSTMLSSARPIPYKRYTAIPARGR